MGQRDLRRLLIIGAMSAIQAAPKRGGAPGGVVVGSHAYAQTRKAGSGRIGAHPSHTCDACVAGWGMARMAWAIMAHGGVCKTPATA